MRNLKTTHLAIALVIGIATVFVLRPSGAEEKKHSSNRFHVTVTDVIETEDSVVKQIRIDSKPDFRATIASDNKGGGGLSASAGCVVNTKQGVLTVTVLADHLEWKAGDVNALKFLMSIHGRSSKSLMSDTGPMSTKKQLNDMLTISLTSGTYEYGTAVPMLRFKDRTYFLSVAAPPTSNP